MSEGHDRPQSRTGAGQAPCSDHLDMRVTEQHHPVPHLQAYLVLIGVFAAGVLGTTLPTPLYVLWQEQYRFPAVMITILFAGYTVGLLTALLFFGRLSDHFGRRPTLLLAVGLACVSTLLFVLAQQVLWLLVGRLLSGLAAGLLTGTAAASLAELHPAGNTRQAGRLTTVTNLGAMGLGPLVAGLFAQFAPAPTRLVFVFYLLILAVTLLLVGVLPEPVEAPDRVFDLRPRLGVASSAHAVFWPAAVTALCLSTLLDLFAALAPTFLRGILHEPNLALAGGVVCVLFSTAAVSLLLMHGLTSRRARLFGGILLLPGLALIEVGMVLSAFPSLLAGTVIAGVGAGLAYTGCLAAINQVAPPERKAEMVSAYFVVASLSSLPVVGVGVLAQHTSLLAASLFLALLLALLLLLTLAALLWFDRRERGGKR
ncbi:MAG TPA: MFS transporter [Ktedonobacterales bacterium]|nr:MFS transporter [Ktedonobacterales bacterium]